MNPPPLGHLKPAHLPAGACALRVLRDWLEQHTGRSDLNRLNEWALAAYGRALAAPAELVEQAQEETEAPARVRLDTMRLHAGLRAKYPNERYGLLTEDEIASAVAAHIDAIRLASSYARPLDAVMTTMIGEARGPTFRDEMVIIGLSLHTTRRVRRPRIGHRSEIRLPKSWKNHYRQGWSPPWLPLPAGWTLSKNRRWLQRPLEAQ